jgi:glutaredoxin
MNMNLVAPLESTLIQDENETAVSNALTMGTYLYTEPGCSACVEAKGFLTSRGIPFEERDIRANPEYQRILRDELDSCTTPTLVTGNNIIIGFDRELYELLPCNSTVQHGTD